MGVAKTEENIAVANLKLWTWSGLLGLSAQPPQALGDGTCYDQKLG